VLKNVTKQRDFENTASVEWLSHIMNIDSTKRKLKKAFSFGHQATGKYCSWNFYSGLFMLALNSAP
jgi:hypothetical protein